MSVRDKLNKKLARHKLLVTKVSLQYFPVFAVAVAISYLATFALVYAGVLYGTKLISSTGGVYPVETNEYNSSESVLTPDTGDLLLVEPETLDVLDEVDNSLNYNEFAEPDLATVEEGQDFLIASRQDSAQNQYAVLGVSDTDSTEYLTKENFDNTVAPAYSNETKVYVDENLDQQTSAPEINRISLSRNVDVNNNLMEYILKIAFPVLALSLSVFGVNLLHSFHPQAPRNTKKKK